MFDFFASINFLPSMIKGITINTARMKKKVAISQDPSAPKTNALKNNTRENIIMEIRAARYNHLEWSRFGPVINRVRELSFSLPDTYISGRFPGLEIFFI